MYGGTIQRKNSTKFGRKKISGDRGYREFLMSYLYNYYLLGNKFTKKLNKSKGPGTLASTT